MEAVCCTWQDTVPREELLSAVANAQSERITAISQANEAREIKLQLETVTDELQNARSETVRMRQALAGMEMTRDAAVSRALTAETAAARSREEALQLSVQLRDARSEAISLKATAEVKWHPRPS
jgi:hypothetical protein